MFKYIKLIDLQNFRQVFAVLMLTVSIFIIISLNFNVLNLGFDKSCAHFEKLYKNYEQTLNQLEQLKIENIYLKNKLNQTFDYKNIESNQHSYPSIEFEKSIRRIDQSINDLWLYLKTVLNLKQLNFFNELRFNLLYDLQVIKQRDNRWRKQRLQLLNEWIEQNITKLQNPIDCNNAKKLICKSEKALCGFGCLSQHWTHCLIGAIALNRTMIFKPQKHLYNKFFQPISDSCRNPNGSKQINWKPNKDLSSYQVIVYPYHNFGQLEPKPDYYPLVIPKQISTELQTLSSEPHILFLGSVLRYLLRTNDEFSDQIEEYKRKIHFRRPIVGLHVRRTDKKSEASYHKLFEYMPFVEDFYNRIDLLNERNSLKNKTKRTVYLATDEPKVWKKEVQPFESQGFEFIGDIRHTETAGPNKRHTEDSSRDLLIDLFMLSECDLIVCTMTSTFCRTAVQLLLSRDPSAQYRSIDYIYYFSGQKFHKQKAILSHQSEDSSQISFKQGDLITIINDLRNGFLNGSISTDKNIITGKYPKFKVEEFIQTYSFLGLNFL